MDQRQSSVLPNERFRAGAHTLGISNHNPVLRPPGVLDADDPTLPVGKPAPGLPTASVEPPEPPTHEPPIGAGE